MTYPGVSQLIKKARNVVEDTIVALDKQAKETRKRAA